MLGTHITEIHPNPQQNINNFKFVSVILDNYLKLGVNYVDITVTKIFVTFMLMKRYFVLIKHFQED